MARGAVEAENKEALRRMFAEVFESDGCDEEVIGRHFAPGYLQTADGKDLDYAAFVRHVEVLKQAVRSTEITVDHLVAEGEEVCSVHNVSAVKRDGGAHEGQVIAYWRFEDGLIVRCRELTRVTSGASEDSDLGSRT